MAYERYIDRMILHSSDLDDTFPERHASIMSTEPKAQSGIHGEDNTPEVTPRRFPRRPRRRSESIEGYEMRDRYWEAMDIIDRDLRDAAKAPAVWDYVYDPVCLPPSGGVRTSIIRRLGDLPIRRAWRRFNSRDSPDINSTRIVEAIMLYERGMALSRQYQCTNCQQGLGISPGCVVTESEQEAQEDIISTGELGLKCSNCLYDGRADQCDAQAPSSGLSQPSRTHTPSQIKRKFSPSPYHLEVLGMVDKALKSHQEEGKDNVILRARQIEMAALEIAQAAHEWGRKAHEKRRNCTDTSNSPN
ncbi:hypothetical protein AAE478_008155 [Parahypoxylon ruwenzoriense]